jgi:hypothetical protein
LIYVGVTSVFLFRLVVGLILGRRLGATSRPIHDSTANADLARLTRLMDVSRVPALAESDAVCVPVTVGVRDPLILLPANWRKWEGRKTSAVLAHELSHVSRNDGLVQAASALYTCFFWFSPLSWWLRYRLAELSEQAADDSALLVLDDRTYYAEVLMDFIASVQRANGRLRPAAIPMAGLSRSSRRIARILNGEIRSLGAMSRRAWVLFVFLAAPIVALAAAVHPILAPKVAPLAASALAPQSKPPAATAHPTQGKKSEWNVSSIHDPAQNPNLRYGDDWIYVSGKAPHRNILGDKIIWDTEYELQEAKARQGQIEGDYIWFERLDKSYIVRDAATLKSAEDLLAPMYPLVKNEMELDRARDELAKRQASLQPGDRELRSKLDAQQADLDKRRTAAEKELSIGRVRMQKGMMVLLDQALATGIAHPE